MILEMTWEDGREARGRYRASVERGIGGDQENPLKEVYGGSILGAKGFIKDALARLKDGIMDAEEISYRRQLRASYSAEKVIDVVAEHFEVTRHDVMKRKGLCRSVAIHLTKKHTGMTNREIGEYFGGLSYSAVAKVQERLLAKAGKDIRVMKTIKAISNKMSNVKG